MIFQIQKKTMPNFYNLKIQAELKLNIGINPPYIKNNSRWIIKLKTIILSEKYI